MIILTEDLKLICDKISSAVDTKDSLVLEMQVEDTYLTICASGNDYYVKAKLNVFENYDFHVTIAADKFLKLISQITTNTVELSENKGSLNVKGNGNYKLPIMQDQNGQMRTITEIKLNSESANCKVKTEDFVNIAKHNGQLYKKKTTLAPIQNFYYVNENGCVNFTTNACVNKFTIEQPFIMLLNNKIVKLFKLFDDSEIELHLGTTNTFGKTQNAVKFVGTDIEFTGLLPGDDLIKQFPIKVVLNRAEQKYPFSISINKDELSKAINRILIFEPTHGNTCEFANGHMRIYDEHKIGYEEIEFTSEDEVSYSACLDLVDFKNVFSSYDSENINISFGDGAAFILNNANIIYVIPEVRYA